MERRLISPGFVEDALDCLHRRGLDPHPLLAAVGIGDLSQPVSNLQYGRLWLAIAEAIGDEFFDEAARPMRPGSFRLLCQVSLHARNLEHALRRALRFLAVVLDDPVGELRLREGLAEITLTDNRGPRRAFAYRTYWLILLGVACWLIGRRIPLLGVDFACAAPPDRHDYHQFFGAPVAFDRPISRLTFSARYLGLPVIRQERALQGFLRGAPANILLRYRHDQGLSARIRARLRATPPADWPDFDSLAALLSLSPATLRRRLRAEGQGYGELKAEIRLNMARQLLRQSRASIAEIAAQLGYGEPSAFHRAFLKLAGTTPAAYRRANRPTSTAESAARR
ncbi:MULTISPECIES: AraC family transcriptional regulator [unclassified Paracoccus (in: a-proteobacteria)]|uniref:AraC family transcriptional regulator n=1 Tax=unclassified Paracoccus (in: a-proteobacteria) TaxID=2688777 RepID=UPI0012B1C20E|nr:MULTISPECIES: AraC family transcriptional regulator [unclassified Paracoccus (in: a-proteobacteria)]UXU76309.1 AraC family transcriptional regulator [Paracoccus sp. SMMA_5]UXU82354.1 AraC family transcriptional regulator [Paracoccus sp. SMMA_5_TC]